MVAVALVGGFWAERHGVGSILAWLMVLQCLAVVCQALIHDKKFKQNSAHEPQERAEAGLPSANLPRDRQAPRAVDGDFGPSSWLWFCSTFATPRPASIWGSF